MIKFSGTINICGTIGYQPQNPWIINGTLMENIIFGKIFNEITYDNVIKICRLDKIEEENIFEKDRITKELIVFILFYFIFTLDYFLSLAVVF